MESFDQSLKYLLHHEPEDFVRFGMGDDAVEVIGPLPSALPARGRDVDGAYRIATRGGEGIDRVERVIHVELHRRHQSVEALGVDVAEAQIRLFRRERIPVLSHVWDLYGDAAAPLLSKRTLAYGGDGSACVYQRVNLRALGWQEVLRRGPPALWSLVALTRDGASEEAIEGAHVAIEARAGWTSAERADHLAVLWFVAEAEGVAARVMQAYFSEERLMESTLYKSIFEKGEARGEARADVRATLREKRETIVEVITRRLGAVDPSIPQRIDAMFEVSPQTVKAWASEALDAVDAEKARQLSEKILATPIPSARGQADAE